MCGCALLVVRSPCPPNDVSSWTVRKVLLAASSGAALVVGHGAGLRRLSFWTLVDAPRRVPEAVLP